MTKEQINYSDYTLDPNKPVEVPINVWSTLFRVVTELSRKENTSVVEYVYSYYNRKTKKKLSNSGKKKMSKEKLDKEYYRDVDLEATRDNVKLTTSTDGLGLVSLELLAAFDAIFKKNVENGNKVLREQPQPFTPEVGPQLVKDDTTDQENEG